MRSSSGKEKLPVLRARPMKPLQILLKPRLNLQKTPQEEKKRGLAVLFLKLRLLLRHLLLHALLLVPLAIIIIIDMLHIVTSYMCIGIPIAIYISQSPLHRELHRLLLQGSLLLMVLLIQLQKLLVVLLSQGHFLATKTILLFVARLFLLGLCGALATRAPWSPPIPSAGHAHRFLATGCHRAFECTAERRASSSRASSSSSAVACMSP